MQLVPKYEIDTKETVSNEPCHNEFNKQLSIQWQTVTRNKTNVNSNSPITQQLAHPNPSIPPLINRTNKIPPLHKLRQCIKSAIIIRYTKHKETKKTITNKNSMCFI